MRVSGFRMWRLFFFDKQKNRVNTTTCDGTDAVNTQRERERETKCWQSQRNNNSELYITLAHGFQLY